MQVVEIMMLDDIPNTPLASFENFTLDKVISILKNYAYDPIINTNKKVLAPILQIIL
jgi:hypothetical protein